MVGALCNRKITNKKTTQEQVDRLGLKDTVDRLAKANGVRWCEHMLRWYDDSVLRVAFDLEVIGEKK